MATSFLLVLDPGGASHGYVKDAKSRSHFWYNKRAAML